MENEKKTGFFEVSPNNFSIMRLAFFVVLLNMLGMGWFTLIVSGWEAAVAITSAGITLATGMKIMQKQQEKSDKQA